MIFLRGWHLHVLAASICCYPTVGTAADPSLPGVSPEAAHRAHALALFYYGATREKALELEPALAAFEELLTLDPANTAVAMRAATIAGRRKDRARGRAIIDAALEASPDQADGYLNLSRYLDLFQPQGGEAQFSARALEVAGMAEERFPGDARVCRLLVDLHLQTPNVGAAASAVRRFAKRDGDSAFWLTLAAEATRCFELDGGEAAENRKEINGFVGKALEASGGSPAVADAVANYHIEARQYELAMKVLEPVVRAHPELGLEREKLARIYRIEGEVEKALTEIRGLVAAYPNEARTQRLLAELLADAGDYDGAVQHRARAVQLGGAEPEDYIEIAAQLADHFEPPRHDEALRWLDRGLALSPIAPRLHYMKGIVLENMDRHEAALNCYRQTEKIAKFSMPELLDTEFYYKCGAAADRAGRTDEASEHYRRAVELVPDDQPELAAKPLNDHGYMLLLQDREIDEAGKMVRRAVELEPDNPVYLDSLGWYYYKKALFKKALVELRRAKQLMGDKVDPDVLEHIAAVRAALGE